MSVARGASGTATTPPATGAGPTAGVCLGIEAGATRTVAIAAGDRLARPDRREFPQANLWLLDEARLARHLRAIARAMPRPASVAIGMAGARTGHDRARVRSAATRAWPGVPCVVTNDLETALMAAPRVTPRGRPAAPGAPAVGARVVIVSGTGSCCFGRAADGRQVRVGGWGHVLGDAGSGYNIVVSAARAVVRQADRMGWPRLGDRLLRALAMTDPHDLVAWVQRAGKAEVAALAVEVFDAAAGRDPIAAATIEAAASRLAADAVECARRIAAPGEPVQFVLAGSVLLKQSRFAARVGRALRGLWPPAVVTRLEREGAWGAVEIARAAIGAPAAVSTAAAAVPASPVPSLRSLRDSPTERRNPRSRHLDTLPIADAVTLMLREDRRVPAALLAERPAITRAVTLVVRAFRQRGRLCYVGAGTSGRLGVLDASECPPTFRTPPAMVQGIIAGGPAALWSSVEGAEDDAPAGAAAVAARGIGRRDIVVGIAASGRTPFVWGALAEARRRGAATVLLCFNPHLAIARRDRPTLVIAPDVGPEVLTGSTRLKAGTATKIVLNTITTIAMARIGRVRGNLMIDMKPSNAKLRERAVRVVAAATGMGEGRARAALEGADWDIRRAVARPRAAARGRPARPRDGER